MTSVRLLKEGLALVDSGPLHMTVQVSEKDTPLSDLAESGALFALDILKGQSDFLAVIKQEAMHLSASRFYPEVVNSMIRASQAMNDPGLTPLAAVAGAASDMVADYVARRGGTKIIVNNGGDIAIRLREEETATVGLRLDSTRPDYDYTALIDRDCGVCTSGLRGRSFTLGVADGVTVMADRAAIADAAATFLGNKTTVDSPRVTRVPAESLYHETDLMGVAVTHSVGALSEKEISTALRAGRREAIRLLNKQYIMGAVISVKGHMDTLGYFVQALRTVHPSVASIGRWDYLKAPYDCHSESNSSASWA